MKKVILEKGGLTERFMKAGIVPDNCRRIVIDISIDDMVRIYYECYGDKRLIDIDIPKYLGPVIKEVKRCKHCGGTGKLPEKIVGCGVKVPETICSYCKGTGKEGL